MVNYEAVINARPEKWHKAAEEWVTPAKHALHAAQDIRDNGSKPLADNWTDEVGQKAAKDLEKLAGQLESAYDILLGGKMLCEAVADSMETALSSAREINEVAQRHSLRIGADGLPEGAPMPGEDPGKLQARECIVALRDHVLQQVGEADNTAAAKFAMLTEQVNLADPDEALKVQNKASQAEMEILGAEIPRDAGAMTQRMWWNGLSEKQRHDLMPADPVALSKLDGLPEDVKREMRGTDGKFDRVKMVEYVLQNWDQKDDVDFGDNCTNFVSESLAHAGTKEKESIWGTRADDTWMKGNPTEIDLPGFRDVDRSLGFSKTWAGAENQQNFLLDHGGEEVPRDQVRPGDIIYYEQAGDIDEIGKGNTHHAAVVTAVMPDGEIKYTQHSDPYRNVSLDGRLPDTEKTEGKQNVRIVRPHPVWY
ncbi:amidase domain-containing protein [Streptomyces sp. NPDC052496]|uniref:amidase domain-containing protein n=1 Tax=Streptomyces sp. NPDC052496 TaxID=3154951 RepID=UPI00342C10A4